LKFQLLIDYPWYFVLLCLLLGAGISYLTYRRNTFASKEKPFGWPVWLMALLRAFMIAITAFLLLSPVVKSLYREVQKPVILIAADNSQSILLNKDSAYYKTQYKSQLTSLVEGLKQNFDVRTFTFSGTPHNNLGMDFNGRQTDIAGLYSYLYDAYYNQNIGAVITLTDGIYNQGEDPEIVAEKFNAPFYTVALGDTSPRRDVILPDVQYNKIAYSGNLMPLKVMLKANDYAGSDVRITIRHAGTVIYEQPVHFGSRSFYSEIDARVEAKGVGMQRYQVEVTHLPGEVSTANNHFDVFVDVLESRRKILMIAQSPEPDISALKNSIERNSSFEVETYLYSEFIKQRFDAKRLANYQLAILHQLPGVGQPATQLIRDLSDAGVSIWYILGSNSSLPAFNTLEAGLQVISSGNRTNEVSGTLNNGFSLFTIEQDLAANLLHWPPLYAPYGTYNVADRQNILLFQKVGKVATEMPLMMFANKGRQKTGILCGEGIWRWFLAEYADKQEFKVTDELVSKTIQYLSVKTDSRQFRVRPVKNIFLEDEAVTFQAEVYNESFEPVKNADIRLLIKNEKGKSFTYQFVPSGDAYSLDAGMMPAGNYTYVANTHLGSRNYTLSGEFIVQRSELESINTVADHHLLKRIAGTQGGQMVYPRQMNELVSLISHREDIKPVSYMQQELKDLIHFKWLFFLLLALLSAEWFLRKYFGSY
jgi:hypothetical protein